MKKEFLEDIKEEKPELKDLIDIIKNVNKSNIDSVITDLEINNILSFNINTNDKEDK